MPFFCTLRKSFEWTDECQKAFEDLKKYLSSPPLLSPSKPGEELYLYIAVSQAAVSAVLVREEERAQRPVYFVNRAFRGAEERYPIDGEVSLRVGNDSAKTQAVLPGQYHHSLDGSAPEKGHEQP